MALGKIGSVKPYRKRWRVVVTAGVRPDGRPRQIVRTADSEALAEVLRCELIAEFGLTGRARGHGRERGERCFNVSALLGGGPYGLLSKRSLRSVADALGISLETARAHYVSGLTAYEADRWSVACGAHPFEVWGWSWIDAADHHALADVG
jgi:hypothetical protein